MMTLIRHVTPEQLEGLRKLKIREQELTLDAIRSYCRKYKMIRIELTAIENRLAEQVKERVTT